ncbi:MAG TPA: arginase [Edaphocola sp.]|nr:arginase [Edaphocola sp.]
MDGLFDFLDEIRQEEINGLPGGYDDLQIGKRIHLLHADDGDWENAGMILLGCGRFDDPDEEWQSSANAVRRALYKMYDWHPSVKVADLGNIRRGAHPSDTRAALRAVLKETAAAGKVVVLLGGTHDQMMQQYEVFEQSGKVIEAAVLDRLINLEDSEGIHEGNFLMPMLTRQPNFLRHFSVLGFQSYDVHPNVLETLDKLRFDCVRLGVLRENLDEWEPTLRHCELLAVDMQVLRYAEAQFLHHASPNGLLGDELCQLLRYAGMSSRLSSLGIYGYQTRTDQYGQGAQLMAQMLWYFVDGLRLRDQEADLRDTDNFFSYHVAISGVETLFIKSKRTGRWWMQMPDLSFVPCSYRDYLAAGNNDIPERWLRAQERIA